MADVKMFLVDVENDKCEVITASDFHEYYKHLGCDLFDIVRRTIGGRKGFQVICDDCGLLKANPIVSALNGNEVMFCGNLLIAGGVDIEGELTSITDDDVKILENSIQTLIDFNSGTMHPVLMNVTY